MFFGRGRVFVGLRVLAGAGFFVGFRGVRKYFWFS